MRVCITLIYINFSLEKWHSHPAFSRSVGSTTIEVGGLVMGVTNSRSAFILYSNVSVPRDSQSPALEAHTRSTITLIGSRARGCVGNAVGTSRNSAAVAACLQPTEAQITQFDPTAS